MAFSAGWVEPDKSVPFGRYSCSRPLVFSLVPRCQGLCGSAKNTRMASRCARRSCSAITCSRSAVNGLKQGGRHMLEFSDKSLSGTQGIGPVEPDQENQARRPLHETTDRRALASPLDQIAFPVAGHGVQVATAAGRSASLVMLGIWPRRSGPRPWPVGLAGLPQRANSSLRSEPRGNTYRPTEMVSAEKRFRMSSGYSRRRRPAICSGKPPRTTCVWTDRHSCCARAAASV